MPATVGFSAADAIHLPTDSPEWRHAWAQIRKQHGDFACLDPCTGEVWQYMGTYRFGRAHWMHQFRHRSLPPTGHRHYVNIPATVGFSRVADLSRRRRAG